jgi:hypothetical protein
MQHHLVNLLFRDGVYERSKTIKAFFHAEIRDLAPLEGGQSLHEIGRAYGKPHSCIRCLLLPRGGIPPAARRRSRLALMLAERENISPNTSIELLRR